MYLYRRIYIGAKYEHRKVKGKVDITIGKQPVKVNFDKISSIEEEVAYWRKDNHIHKWFVDNCQDGEDDCRTAYVERDKLKELCDLCRKVLGSKGKKKAKKVAQELLPPQEGFFFGGTEIDEYYYESLEYTMGAIFQALLEDEDADFYYHSSW